MASALRPTLLRQVHAASTTQRASSSLIASLRTSQQTPASLLTSRVSRSAFQTSAARKILPPLPQVIRGGVNDPAPVPETHPSHGSYHWTAERAVSIGLIPLTVMPFAVGSLNPLLDGTLIGLTILHSYIGFGAAITDYFPSWRVPKVRKIADWANVLMVFIVAWGYYEFETNDVGVTAGIARIWRAGANAKDAEAQIEKKVGGGPLDRL
ncbi:Putative succinate dehydrogenase [ubiquinone] cytochrome b small subunit, CybS [Septoria linicola]|uniref:Succinate dehydrogenase [ubiquinone] cytochrome b small subunit n=1 Tax=Septoria linicola TaxID=215465 RepID=A0A9Q9ANC0_9PEZI|nr:putative succinate dehydrogenase [ubiquinone] cytochrome b small subunit, CybS [Septoria linicola]USW49116.1 Putative succinate dehydrogenase [ubiquinone] cytochrome b small subunit, CybS [Septoria linicola]